MNDDIRNDKYKTVSMGCGVKEASCAICEDKKTCSTCGSEMIKSSEQIYGCKIELICPNECEAILKLRYPMKRFAGTYTVDDKFWVEKKNERR